MREMSKLLTSDIVTVETSVPKGGEGFQRTG